MSDVHCSQFNSERFSTEAFFITSYQSSYEPNRDRADRIALMQLGMLQPRPMVGRHHQALRRHPTQTVARSLLARTKVRNSSPSKENHHLDTLRQVFATAAIIAEQAEVTVTVTVQKQVCDVHARRLSSTCIDVHQVDFGAVLKAVGSGPALGDWDVKKGIPLVWSEGNVWSATLSVPVGETARFKASFLSSAMITLGECMVS